MSTVPKTATARMTVNEFWEFVNRPENEPRQFDLIRGEVVEMSRPTKLHGFVQLRLGSMIQTWAASAGRGYVVVESGVVLDEAAATVVGPDVAYYTDADRFEDVPPKWGDVPPELAAEILSPNDKMSKVNAKIREYLLSGTKLVWLVDYEERKVWAYRPNRVYDEIAGDSVLTGGDEFPGLAIPLADLFRFPKALTQPPPA